MKIKNDFTDQYEELLFLDGNLHDGMDPHGAIAAMYQDGGVVQVAQGFDMSAAAMLGFVLKAWRHQDRGMCFCCL